MFLKDVLAIVVDVLLRKLPKWLAGRLYSVERLRDELEVDVRSTHALSLTVSGSPHGWGWLRFTNRSPITVEVVHAEMEVWDGQPLCKLRRQMHLRVPGKKTVEIYCEDFLSEWQARRAHAAHAGGSMFTIYARVSVATPYGVEELGFGPKEGVHGDVTGVPAATVFAPA